LKKLLAVGFEPLVNLLNSQFFPKFGASLQLIASGLQPPPTAHANRTLLNFCLPTTTGLP
jgi:hypothetical protein